MRTKAHVIGLHVSDIHLSQKPPLCRDEEADWFLAMRRPLEELRRLQEKYKVPIFCTGDIFHRYNSTPELINFAMEYLPKMYAVPGQHDLPQHNYEDIKKSAYWSLVGAGSIVNVEPGASIELCVQKEVITLWGFPWGTVLHQLPEEAHDENIHIALIHKYIWKKKTIPAIEDEENCFIASKQKLKGFDFALFGDNHIGFTTTAKSIEDPVVINGGSMMRRSTLQRDYKPFIGILYDDGSVEPYFLNVSKDTFRETTSEAELQNEFDLSAFVAQIENLEEYKIDFEETVRRHLTENNINEGIANKLLLAMED